MMSKWRRFLYLVLDDSDKATYPLRRIDASRLFYPANQKVTTTPPQVEDDRLPEPFISFTVSPTAGYGSRVLDFFAPFGRGENKSLIAGADENGLTVMYDLAHRTVHNQLRLNSPKHIIDAVFLAVGDSLYVIFRTPVLDNCHGSFEALVYDGEQYNKHDESIWEWRWRCLDPPPYVLEPGYKPTRIGGYTVVGGSEIWVSAPGIGTYAFDTSAGTWRKAGEWVLPFRDRAEYVPECDTWLGFSSRTGLLCSSDLRRARPVVSGALEEEVMTQERQGCVLSQAYLVRLGSGKFCVAKFFRKEYNLVSKECYVVPQLETFVIFTGFVMDLDGPGGSGVLRMTKHKSRRYMIPGMGFCTGWVF